MYKKRIINIYILMLVYVLFNAQSVKAEQSNIIDNSAEDTQLINDDLFNPLDIQLIPEYEQVDQGIINKNPNLKVEKYFSTQNLFGLEMEESYLTVNSVSLYDVYHLINGEASTKINKGIILVDVSITNTSNQPLQLSSGDFHLNIQGNQHQYLTSSQLYPLNYGEFSQIIDKYNNVIKPEQTVEGYLTFGLSEEDYSSIKEMGFFQIEMQSHQQKIKVQKQDKTKEKNKDEQNDIIIEKPKVYLPSNSIEAEKILNNSKFLQDRISKLWMGEKVSVANVNLDKKLENNKLQVTFNKLEVTDLIPRDPFKQFIYLDDDGTIFYTLSYSIENNKEHDIYIDTDFIESELKFNRAILQSDKRFYDSKGLIKLEPKENIKLITVFKIDKLDFQSNLQNETAAFVLDLPIQYMDDNDNLLKENVNIQNKFEIGQSIYLNQDLEWE